MQSKRIERIQQVPVPNNERKCTDIICLILWLLFVSIMLISAIVQFNKANLLKINFPTDSDYKNCGYQLQNYPFLYFTNPTGNDITKRVCVNQCPKAGDTHLICSPTSTINCGGPDINIYDSSATIDRLGAFCIPTDPLLLKSALISYNLIGKWNFLKSLDVVKWSLGLALLLGIVYFISIQFIPNFVVWVGMIFGGIGLILLGGILFVDDSYSLITYHPSIKTIAVVLTLCGILLLGFTWWSNHQIKVCSVFVDSATIFLRNSFSTILYIPLFIIITFAFIALIIFQYLSYSASKDVYVNPGDIYWNGSNLTLWNFLNGVELLWGIFILRDSFNFLVSGNSIEWYFTHTATNCCAPFSRLLCLNLGSIIFGAFLNCFLAIPELLIDILNPSQDGRCRSCVNPCYCMCGLLFNTFNLIRTDAYSYINLVGTPYCNSARQCEYICHRSPVFEGSQSAIRIYRIGSHIMIISLVLLVSYFVSKRLLLNNDVSFMALVCVFFITYSTAAYFLLMHLDAAEGIMTSFLVEHQLANEDYNKLIRCPGDIKEKIRVLQEQHMNKLG